MMPVFRCSRLEPDINGHRRSSFVKIRSK